MQANKPPQMLLIIRTPFQAWMALSSGELVLGTYDLVYMTQHNSEEDQHYYHQLANNASESSYIYVQPQRFDILNHFLMIKKLPKWSQRKEYNKLMLASINACAIAKLVKVHKRASLITFDDGMANIIKSGQYSDTYDRCLRKALYRALFGAYDIKTVKTHITKHYSVFPQFENIVERNKIIPIVPNFVRHDSQHGTPKVFLIGFPANEVFGDKQLLVFKKKLKDYHIDFYVKHPRERTLLLDDVPVLDKQGRIAEEAILMAAGDHSIHLIGGFSTVMFTLGEVVAKRTIFLEKDSPTTQHKMDMLKKTTYEVILI